MYDIYATYTHRNYVDISVLTGVTLTSIEGGEDTDYIKFISEDKTWVMTHLQDCCEIVTIESVVGDLNDLVGTPILLAQEVDDDGGPMESHEESHTWTFYKLSTVKGHVTIRWYGSSNGYYSESVDFFEVIPND